jgi:hypothetical protein
MWKSKEKKRLELKIQNLELNSSVIATLQNSQLVFQCSSVGPFGIGKGLIFLIPFFAQIFMFCAFIQLVKVSFVIYISLSISF